MSPDGSKSRKRYSKCPEAYHTILRGVADIIGLADIMPSRFGLSVETRREYGWLRMVFSGVRLFRAPIWWPSGGWRHARGRGHCRGEPGSSLSGGYAPDSAKAEGSSIVDEPREG